MLFERQDRIIAILQNTDRIVTILQVLAKPPLAGLQNQQWVGCRGRYTEYTYGCGINTLVARKLNDDRTLGRD